MARQRKKRDDEAQSRLEKLREKMGQVDTGGSKDFWKPQADTDTTIRILPPVGDMEIFFQPVGRHHNLPGEDGPTSEICPEFTSFGQMSCPICELAATLNRGSKADKALASKIWLRKSFWMNIIVRDDDDEEGETGNGPFIFTPGVKIYGAIETLVNNPDWGDPSDEVNGYDLIVSRKGAGRNDTSYQVQTRRYDVPIHYDPEKEDEFIDNCVDLSFVVLTEDPDEDEDTKGEHWVAVKPYDRIVDEFGLGESEDVDYFLEDVADIKTDGDDDGDGDSKKDRKPKRRTSGRARADADVDDEGEAVGREVRKRGRRRRR